jgi:hypothetical protein
MIRNSFGGITRFDVKNKRGDGRTGFSAPNRYTDQGNTDSAAHIIQSSTIAPGLFFRVDANIELKTG